MVWPLWSIVGLSFMGMLFPPFGQLLLDSIRNRAFYLLVNLKGAFCFLDGFRVLAQFEKS